MFDHEPSPAPAGVLSERACRLLAGLDVGVRAALLVLTWYLTHSRLRGEPWWAKLNMAGAAFYGHRVYNMGFSRASLAGLALIVVVYALLGAAFGLFARLSGSARNLLMALGLASVWQVLLVWWLLPTLDPWAPEYFPVLATLPAHLLVAIAFSGFAGRFEVLALSLGHPDWAARFAPPPEVADAPAEPPVPAAEASAPPEDNPLQPAPDGERHSVSESASAPAESGPPVADPASSGPPGVDEVAEG